MWILKTTTWRQNAYRASTGKRRQNLTPLTRLSRQLQVCGPTNPLLHLDTNIFVLISVAGSVLSLTHPRRTTYYAPDVHTPRMALCFPVEISSPMSRRLLKAHLPETPIGGRTVVNERDVLSAIYDLPNKNVETA